MIDSHTKNTETLLRMAVEAYAEMSDLTADLTPKGSVDALEVCLDHIENIGTAANTSGHSGLATIAEDLHIHFGVGVGVLTPELGSEIVTWMGKVALHVESPDDVAILECLLKPLPAEIKTEMRIALKLPEVEEIVVEEMADTAEAVITEGQMIQTEPLETDDKEISMSAEEKADTEFPLELGNEDTTLVAESVANDDSETPVAGEQFPEVEFPTELADEDAVAASDAGEVKISTSAEEAVNSEFPVELEHPVAMPDTNGLDDSAIIDKASAETEFPIEITDETVVAASDDQVKDGEEFDMSIFDDDGDADFGDDNLLGMLAYELQEVSPQLNELAKTITSTDEPSELIEAITAYQEVVYRVSSVSEGLGLHGLVLVTDFVSRNTLQVAEMALADRAGSLEVLQGWPDVIIDHLAQPKDDALCLAVVDYLEKDLWPEPLPYADVRDLIEGLTKELEMTGDYEVEARDTEAKPEDVSLEMSEDASAKLIEAFFAESPGHAETFSALVESIANGHDIQNNVEAAQRIAHTLKGSGNLVGTKGIANLAHHIEDIFEYIAKQKITPPPALAHTMQEAADTIEVMLEFLQGMAEPPEDAQRVLQDVLDWANRIDEGNLRASDLGKEVILPDRASQADTQAEAGQAAEDSAEIRREPADTPHRRASDKPGQATDAPNVPVYARAEAVRVPTVVLDNIFRIVGETSIAIGQIQEHLNRLEDGNKQVRKNDGALQQRRYELENLVSIRGMAARHRSAAVAGSDSGFDPLEMDEYDEFYGVTHAYIEGVADSREILGGITYEVSNLNNLFLLQQRLNKELQQVVMTTRMVPVSNISARLHRAVRQVCRATGKLAELNIVGEELLIDGDVLNKLADPLMHMIRNAVDHSIEDNDARLKNGKSEKGSISLIFEQEGNNVVVACSDDGSGLDYERIRETAIKRGLMTAQEPSDNPTLARMILQSGFSTRDQVTQVSGRGVGMDVVNNTIQGLNGSMDIGDAETGGTRISLRLPITLLTSHCLLVGVGKDMVYAIPTSTLAQILSPGIGKIGDVGGKQTFQLDQDIYPSHSLNSLLGLAEDESSDTQNKTVLLLQASEGLTAITVDQVVSSYDLVVKNMGAYVKEVRGVAGVSTLGDGSVVSVLDLSTLLQSSKSGGVSVMQGSSITAPQADEAVLLPKVLIVDDSLSVRNSLSQLMSDGGYRVVAARDGLEAVDMLDKEQPDIVLTDLEMPRMNGLELANYIRKSEQWNPMPIVMITSRTMAKHRQQAEDAGINRYITKPFTEDEVLASIDDHLAQASGSPG